MLKGKTALVTGSTSGIGLGIAESLAAQGAHIVVNGFGDADAAQAEIARAGATHGIRTGYHNADMSKPDQIDSMMRYIDSAFGGVDILVNNAGIQHVANIEDFPVDRWDAIIAINLSSAFHTMRLAIPGMRKKNWGRIINIASAHGLVASAQKSAYVAAKHGIVGLTKAGALETAQTGITVNAICPGWVLTPLVQKQVDARAERGHIAIEQAKRELLMEKQPSGEFVTPAQLGALAVFLCSEAAAQVRGAAWNMDGGWVAQ
jgi:3-hydroxybutyrate dehydrogenase